MSQASLTSSILSVLEEQDPKTALNVGEIVDSVTQRYDESNRIPGANEIRGRLTKLRKEGVVERPERGRYMLVRTEPTETDHLVQLVNVVSEIVRQDALRRTVLWDASPYLQLAEDGGPGTRLVVEHEQAKSLSDEVEVAWPSDDQVVTWTAKTTGPVGPLLWEPEESAPYRIPVGIVFVERKKFGATGVTPQGYRTPFQERIVAEFLGENGPAEATPIVQTVLNDRTTTLDRLWQAAESLGADVNLGIMLAGLGSELRPELRDAFVAELPPVVKTLIRGNR